ncbi:MAG: GUN4 domain-containing protein [Cyanobacteria bacterium P01_D01_bin.105]
MKTNVHDKSAIAFSRGFYSVLCSSKLETLPSSQLYESVFDAGSLAVDMVKFSDSGSPTIYRRTSCSQLSQLKQSQKTTTSRRWHKALLYSLFCISFAGISSQVVHPVSEQKASSRIETVYKLPEELSKELSEEIKQLDLSQLSILLEEKEWQAADQKTGELILIAAGRYRDGFLSGKSIEELSCTHLEAIDNLWDIHTDGRFSFRKQAEIWNSLSRNLQSFDYDVYKEFGKTVGWYVPEDDLWLSPSDASFSLTAPDGHFPSGGRGGIWSFGERGTELLKRCDYALSQQ